MDRAGYYLKQTNGVKAFIPCRLPPHPPIEYDFELATLQEKASFALGALRGYAEIIPNPKHFISMYIRRWGSLSSWQLFEKADIFV